MIKSIAEKIRQNIQKVIVGKDQSINFVLTALICNGHILLEDVPGTGKTLLVKSLAASLDCSFRRIQFTPDLLPSDITGIRWFNPKDQNFQTQQGPIFSQVVLADEINRATPRTQSALLEAMQEQQVTIDGLTYTLDKPFIVIATQNPIELEGTFPLPEAQLDRFLMKINMDYPLAEEEDAILLRFYQKNPLEDLQAICSPADILALQQARKKILVDDSLRDYIIRIARKTRTHEDIQLGASPRASLAMLQCAQAYAGIQGREYVIPDDIKSLAPSILLHRLIISPQAQLRGRGPKQLIEDIINAVPVPVES
ncbi:MAG: MoxR family ATPase [Anaerolineaceae bacterium]|nr:MoxR family ATPase [Anaerolineaceae bacterium]